MYELSIEMPLIPFTDALHLHGFVTQQIELDLAGYKYSL